MSNLSRHKATDLTRCVFDVDCLILGLQERLQQTLDDGHEVAHHFLLLILLIVLHHILQQRSDDLEVLRDDIS